MTRRLLYTIFCRFVEDFQMAGYTAGPGAQYSANGSPNRGYISQPQMQTAGLSAQAFPTAGMRSSIDDSYVNYGGRGGTVNVSLYSDASVSTTPCQKPTDILSSLAPESRQEWALYRPWEFPWEGAQGTTGACS